VLIVKGDAAIDVLAGTAVRPLPEARDDVVINNRVRREIAGAIATLRLASSDRAVRLTAVKALQGGATKTCCRP